MEIRLEQRPDWHAQAACREHDGNLWYPERGHTATQGRRICAGCPEFARCLEYALARREFEGVWGGASWRQRRRLSVVWVQRAHDYRPDCKSPACRWCRMVDGHREACAGNQGPMQINGPGARCGFKSSYARGCRCGPCSMAISPVGAQLRAAGYDVMTWWIAWFGTNTERRLVMKAKRLAEFDVYPDAA